MFADYLQHLSVPEFILAVLALLNSLPGNFIATSPPPPRASSLGCSGF